MSHSGLGKQTYFDHFTSLLNIHGTWSEYANLMVFDYPIFRILRSGLDPNLVCVDHLGTW
jgi:hypothetical protein